MKYYVIVVSRSEAGENRPNPSAFTTRDGAIQMYHSQMSSAMAGTAINFIEVIVANDAGGIELVDVWQRATAN